MKAKNSIIYLKYKKSEWILETLVKVRYIDKIVNKTQIIKNVKYI